MIIKYTLVYICIIGNVNGDHFDKYKLDQVLIMSRHNVRTPLSKDLSRMTPKTWPHWKEKSGYLTSKGALLEGYMGKYFSQWLYKEGLLSKSCPTEEDIFVYANVKQRTIASANAFVENAFPNCNVTVHFNKTDTIDPIFNVVVHNSTDIFKRIALEEMTKLLKSLQLNTSYEYLENILDYKDSDICKNSHKCNLTADKNTVIFAVGAKPNVLGPLKIGNSVIDAFIMEYYEGLKKVAWGDLDEKKWNLIMNISRGYHNVIFNTTSIAKDIAKPLVKYISNLFLNDNKAPKITLLMGHDANMYTLLKTMSFKPYTLWNQHEITPVGGKILFQKWRAIENGRNLLRIQYVYMSSHQMRTAQEINLLNPPEFSLLQLKNCPIDHQGFCPWEDFERLLKNLYCENVACK